MNYLKWIGWAVTVLMVYGCRTTGGIVPERLRTTYAPLDNKLSGMVMADSFALSVAEARQLEGALFIDTRNVDEYLTSHLPGAIYLGFNRPDFGVLDGIDPTTPLVVYCTVGYRSERIAADLRDLGFARVYNLYGSLYAWRLAGHPLVDQSGPTDRIHTYNRKWGTYIPDTLGTKTY